jgi:hypothetical protein
MESLALISNEIGSMDGSMVQFTIKLNQSHSLSIKDVCILSRKEKPTSAGRGQWRRQITSAAA